MDAQRLSFDPPLWPAYQALGCWKNPHLQTIYASIGLPAPTLSYVRERLELNDGDFLDLDWLPGDPNQIVLMLHGLQGSSRSGYIRRAAERMNTLGLTICAMNFRGRSGEQNRLARGYHSGAIEDLQAVIEHIGEKDPSLPGNRAIALVGYSLGGNLLLRWLADRPALQMLRIAVAVSAPLDLNVAVKRLDRGLSRLYQRWLLSTMKRDARAKLHLFPDGIDRTTIDKIDSFYDYDQALTAPLHGYKNAEDYYARASSRPMLTNIELPCIIVNAADDPFMDPSGIPAAHELSSACSMRLSLHGGHVAFIQSRHDGALESAVEANLARLIPKLLS